MRILIPITLLLSAYQLCTAQTSTVLLDRYTEAFEEAYAHHPEIPVGTLEAVAYAQTRMNALSAEELPSCSGLPSAIGLFGLIENGQDYFRNTLTAVAALSGHSEASIKSSPRIQTLSYATALTNILPNAGWDAVGIAQRVLALSALPQGNAAQEFARQSELYQILTLICDHGFMSALNATPHPRSWLSEVFGENLQVLSASVVMIDGDRVTNGQGDSFERGGGIAPCYDYAADAYVQTPSCNYSSRSGTAISAVTVHTIQGSYAGAISWAQNCNANVSYHYVVRSSDGQVTQMLCESLKGWHVGSENPYTIGIEHEGWVSEPQWYTNAMYQGSANIVRDITNSGYGISAQRTSFFPWAATTNYNGTNTPGSCVRIKGHQHFPNQTHTDPGQYWNWDHYFKLLNPNTPVTVLSTATGDFYDTGGAIGTYGNDERTITRIQPGGSGTTVTVTFTQFNLENNWDYLYIYDGPTVFSSLIGYYTGTNSPGTITSSGDALTFEFRSDCATTAQGWAASWTSTSPDNTAPSTVISQHGWETQNFTATFNDTDNPGGSGVNERFWQVMDFDGNEWRANGGHGFLNDNFLQGSIHSDWSQVSGTWSVNGGHLVQSDEASSNTNIHIPVVQTAQHSYLYHWGMNLTGTGTNRRAGIHFFCDNPALTNRGNSYFVFYRVESNKCQIYKVVNDTWTLMTDDNIVFNANTWYDLKVIFSPSTGSIRAYLNDALVSEWTDPSPHQSGVAVSLRTAGTSARYNDVKVYRSRGAGETVTVGPTGMARYQNPSPAVAACRIRTLITDVTGNWSQSVAQDVNIDWTPPTLPPFVNDGTGADIDLTASLTELSANWGGSTDPHSGLTRYEWSIGTAAGLTDLVGWTDNGTSTASTANGLSLIPGQWYYYNVRAENGAGLTSTSESSNGQLVDIATSAFLATDGPLHIFPNPTTGIIHLPGAQGMQMELLDAMGRMVVVHTLTSDRLDLRGMGVAEGMYMLRVTGHRGPQGAARVVLTDR